MKTQQSNSGMASDNEKDQQKTGKTNEPKSSVNNQANMRGNRKKEGSHNDDLKDAHSEDAGRRQEETDE